MNSKRLLAHGFLLAREGSSEDLIRILVDASKLCKSNYSCFSYIISTDSNEPEKIWVTETWESEEEMNRALADKEVLDLIKKAIPLLKEQPTKGQRLIIRNE